MRRSGQATLDKQVHSSDPFPADEEGLPLTPLLDTVFILFLYVMISVHFVPESQKIHVELPRIAGESGNHGRELLLEIERDGSLRRDGVSLTGAELPNVLKQVCPAKSIRLAADREAHFEVVMGVLKEMQQANCKEMSVDVSGKGK